MATVPAAYPASDFSLASPATWPRQERNESAAGWNRSRILGGGLQYHCWVETDSLCWIGFPAVGQVGLLMCTVEGIGEAALGYLIHRAFWRRGIATEAAAACLEYGFHTLGKTRIISLIRPENLPSQGVARKVGMKLERPTAYAGFEHLMFSVSNKVTRASSP